MDYHTAGEPFRIVVSDVGEIAGANVRERRETAVATEPIDRVRRLLCHEPRGHADMYGCFVVPPDDEDADRHDLSPALDAAVLRHAAARLPFLPRPATTIPQRPGSVAGLQTVKPSLMHPLVG